MTATYLPVSSPVPGLRAALMWLLVLGGVLFLAGFEQGTLTSGTPVLHEAFHDARHLLGFPCH